MANEILYSGLGDQRLTEILAKEWLLSLADREMIQQSPALVYAGDAQGSGSATIKISEIDFFGADPLAAVAEGAAIGNTALGAASYTVTVARQSKQYTESDLARLTDGLGAYSAPAAWMRDAVISAGMRLTTQIAELMPGFSQSVGATGVNLTVANWFEAIATLETGNVKGPYMAIIHSQQYADIRDAMRSETGPLQMVGAVQDSQRVRAVNSLDLFGVDVFVSNQIPTANAGADRAGGMFGRGAVLWADATVPPNPALAGRTLQAGKVFIEFGREQERGETKVTTNYYCGVAEGIDLAGVGIVTDA